MSPADDEGAPGEGAEQRPGLPERSDPSRTVRVIYGRTAPCPANFLETFSGRTIYDLQRRAHERRAHAVLVDTTGSAGSPGAPLSGTAITWVEGTTCHR